MNIRQKIKNQIRNKGFIFPMIIVFMFLSHLIMMGLLHLNTLNLQRLEQLNQYYQSEIQTDMSFANLADTLKIDPKSFIDQLKQDIQAYKDINLKDYHNHFKSFLEQENSNLQSGIMISTDNSKLYLVYECQVFIRLPNGQSLESFENKDIEINGILLANGNIQRNNLERSDSFLKNASTLLAEEGYELLDHAHGSRQYSWHPELVFQNFTFNTGQTNIESEGEHYKICTTTNDFARKKEIQKPIIYYLLYWQTKIYQDVSGTSILTTPAVYFIDKLLGFYIMCF
ncbi:hypothetical protein HZY91_07155 [Facklamia sp. DSM 111018]|uniref:Uncharacterized protein n=1 Tax=Facklamia lactis TaxID=2749967 RepID=A0ABS0LTJ1_9LACT|nr:hypothetical protein [Facklamia lactis]MBG9980966.1 hypothetical protein [Facklamia lactis]MBG9986671.1 hypothetical protein [Facklamia lactis]